MSKFMLKGAEKNISVLVGVMVLAGQKIMFASKWSRSRGSGRYHKTVLLLEQEAREAFLSRAQRQHPVSPPIKACRSSVNECKFLVSFCR
jgi:hypothetical protein